jgi:hypothetical protein
VPIEVGEIGISLNVADQSGTAARPRGATADDSCGCGQAKEQRDDLVEECVRRVLAVLKAQQER